MNKIKGTTAIAMLAHWVKFNLVGLLGIFVQLLVLRLCLHFGMDYLIATALAVEAAVLHNFVLHERWTWKDRPATGSIVFFRLLKFNSANGLISIFGNLLFMLIFHGWLAIKELPASLLSIALCSLINFFVADKFVFKGSEV